MRASGISGNIFGNKERAAELIFVALCGIYFFIWSITKDYNFGPDEYTRYAVPQYIFEHGTLPNGYLEEIRNRLWGFSYAFYPTFLGPLLSAFFMKIVSLFTADSFALVVGARFTSVLSGTLTVWFLIRSFGRLFSCRIKWVAVFFTVFIPQVPFLCSYVNNDIICVCGSAMILYAWICGTFDGWRGKNSALLAAGIVVIALSYYNAYGWILCSIPVFFGGYALRKNIRNNRAMWKNAGLIVGIVVLCTGFFFIRNAVLYDGDFLGMRSLTESSEQYAIDSLKPSNRDTAANIGMSVTEMLFSDHWGGRNWIESTGISFIAAFGYMQYFIPKWGYFLIGGVLVIGLIGCVLDTVEVFRRKEAKNRKNILLLRGALLAALLIPIALSVWYSYAVDYQPQGRYCYPAFAALMFFWGTGASWWVKRASLPASVKNIAAGISIAAMLCISYCFFMKYYLPY